MTTRDELREKVAQAISDATLDWCGETPEIWDSHRIAADAALAVVRAELAEPSEAMTDAVWGASLGPMIGERQMPPGFPGINTAIYQAMLSASPLAEPGA